MGGSRESEGGGQNGASGGDAYGDHPSKRSASASKLLLSYRFLRSGIVAVVALLGTSLVYDIVHSEGCVRGSISAYFYSPVRTTFTGGLLAIGLCLIVLQGDRGFEEFSLNVAGMLAPVVAFVPTKVSTACPASEPLASATEAQRSAAAERLAIDVTEGMQNNMAVYLGVIMVVLILLFIWPHSFVTDPKRLWWLRIAIGCYAALGGVGTWWLWNYWDGKDSSAHNVAAYAMFGFFGVVVLINGAFRARTTGLYKLGYLLIFVAMVASAVVILLNVPDEHRVFVLEAVEIGLFGTFWVVQTVQFRNEEPTADVEPVQARPSATT